LDKLTIICGTQTDETSRVLGNLICALERFFKDH
jgi:hypothetical protein